MKWPLIFVLVLACNDTRRGCAKRAEEAATDPLLSEIDCPGGVARCASGIVDVTTPARRPASCRGEQCTCPRRVIGACDEGAAGREGAAGPAEGKGCVHDNVEIAVQSDDDALARLCGPVRNTAGVLLRDVPRGAPEVECVRGEIRVNGDAVARCARACAVEGDALPSTDLDARTLMHLMCARTSEHP